MIKVDLTNIQSFLRLPYEAALSPRLKIAHSHLQLGDGTGGEFTGWVHLPRDYDRAEYDASRRRQKRSRAIPRHWWSSASAAPIWAHGA